MAGPDAVQRITAAPSAMRHYRRASEPFRCLGDARFFLPRQLSMKARKARSFGDDALARV
jgi:hypothetical protein